MMWSFFFFLSSCLPFSQLQFFELNMLGDTKAALDFLRSKLRHTFDLAEESDRKTFESLASIIFCHSTIDPAPYLAGQVTLEELLDTPVSTITPSEDIRTTEATASRSQEQFANIHNARNAVFERLTRYFPTHMTQPSIDLLDLLPLGAM